MSVADHLPVLALQALLGAAAGAALAPLWLRSLRRSARRLVAGGTWAGGLAMLLRLGGAALAGLALLRIGPAALVGGLAGFHAASRILLARGLPR